MARLTLDAPPNSRRRSQPAVPAMLHYSTFFPLSRYSVHTQVPPRRTLAKRFSTGAGLRIHTTVPASRPFEMIPTRPHARIAKEAELSDPDTRGISKVHL